MNHFPFLRTLSPYSKTMKTILTSIVLFLVFTSINAQSETHDLANIMTVMDQNDARWVTFLKKERLLAGVYTLKAGDTDQQQPHDTDELYYVVEGSGSIDIDGSVQEIQKGKIIYVPAMTRHQFTDISEDLVLLVVFDQ